MILLSGQRKGKKDTSNLLNYSDRDYATCPNNLDLFLAHSLMTILPLRHINSKHASCPVVTDRGKPKANGCVSRDRRERENE